PLRLLTKLTWLLMGPVSKSAFCSNGGFALKTWVLPTSLSVIQTSSFSGVTAIFGQNGLACGNLLMTSCEATSITASSGVKLEQTKPYFPSEPNTVIPGPFANWMRRVSFIVAGSTIET